MVPAAFVKLESLPLTPNGKVDRKALPQPDLEAGIDKSNFVAPGTPTEIVLAGIWYEVLGLNQVGIHDNFFELGGHFHTGRSADQQNQQVASSPSSHPGVFSEFNHQGIGDDLRSRKLRQTRTQIDPQR